ncbi:MAG: response regulator [Anaerolineae bacterium]
MSRNDELPGGKLSRLKVLIADDAQEARRSTRLMMTLIPAVEVVAVANDGREAIELARKHRPDVALMDVNMPEIDGLAAIEAMMQERPEMACIIISAERDNDTLRRAMAVGARGYLTKPFTSEQLIEAMRNVSQVVVANRHHTNLADRLRRERDAYLEELAAEYARARRTDDKARQVFEELAAKPDCNPSWLMALAMIYLMRKEWGKLKTVAGRLEEGQRLQVPPGPLLDTY